MSETFLLKENHEEQWSAPIDTYTDTVYGTQSLRRSFQILRTLAEQERDVDGIRFTDLVEATNIPAGTVHRIVKALMLEGMIERHPNGRALRLGPTAFEIGIAAAPHFDLVEISSTYLQRIADHTGEASFLFIRRGNDAVCINRALGDQPLRTPFLTLGSRQPLGINGGGLALLMGLKDNEIREILAAINPRLEVYSNTDMLDIYNAIVRSKQLGFASIGERAVPGVSAVGVPVLDHTGYPIAALSIAAASERLNAQREVKLAQVLLSESQKLATFLSFNH